MAIVKPFKGLRTPNQEVCEELACLPYDVMNSEEAAQMAAGKPKSLLHVTRLLLLSDLIYVMIIA